MKNILILTDFSENATHAAECGVIPSSKLHAEILLLNTFVHAIGIPNYSGVAVTTGGIIEMEDESKENLKILAERLDHQIAQLPVGEYRPSIKYQLGEGSLSNNIVDLNAANNIDMIIMGAPSDGTFEHIMMGSDTYEVAQKTSCPILVIPHAAELNNIKKLVFATSFDAGDLKAFRSLATLCEFFNGHLEVIHVSLFGENKNAEHEKGKLFLDEIKKLKDMHITYQAIHGKDVVERITRQCSEIGADILAMTHHQYTFFAGLLQKSTTKKALTNLKIPLLIFPLK